MKIIWALFDSGNGCYKKAVQKYFSDTFEIYSIGIDVENKNEHFINLDLADYSILFQDNKLYDTLDSLPQPDIILASPPCESWSVATSMKDGNASWYTDTMENLFGEMKSNNSFTIRTREQIESHNEITSFKKHWYKCFYSRVNGELCAFNTTQIIERYKPKIWVIENPQASKIWKYLDYIHGFKGIKNVAHYCAYSDETTKKPTIFMSNIAIPLKRTNQKAKVAWTGSNDGRKEISTSYNERSNIPLNLIKDILDKCLEEL